MKRIIDFEVVLGFGGLVVGLIGIGYAIGSRNKLNDVCEKLDTTIDAIAWDLDVDVANKIKDSMVNEAITRAVETRVARDVDREVRRVADSTRRTIDSEVRTAVKTLYPDIRKSVTKQITSEVSKISAEDLASEV